MLNQDRCANKKSSFIAEYDSQLATNPQVSYLTADHLGSPRVITDGRGAVIARHDYMAFGSDITETLGNIGGRTTAQGFNSSDEVRKQYTGYERDDESGLDYAQARYYNSSQGRFTSVDPLTASANVKDPQTFNRYTYVLNSPYKFTDPLGLISQYAGSACGNGCQNSDGSGGPTQFDDNSSKVWRLSERVVVNPPQLPPTQGFQGNDTANNNQAPQGLIAEAIENIVSVIVTGGGKPDREGIMAMTSDMLEKIKTALGDAWVAGVDVGSLAKTTNGIILITSGTLGEQTSIGSTITFASDSLGGEFSGSESISKEKNYEKLNSKAIIKDKEELAANTSRANQAAIKLENTPVTITTIQNSKNVVERNVNTPLSFWQKAIGKEVDLMYRRGVKYGFDNTNATSAISNTPRK